MAGVGLEILTVAESYAADAFATAHGIPGVELMANAGAGIASAIRERWAPRSTVVLAGPGANGGDGWVVARLLAEAGWPVRLALLGAREKLSGDAAHHAAFWTGPVEPLAPAALEGAALVVDAIFGAGLARPVAGVAAETLEAAAAGPAPIVAVDLPSGVAGDT
ncbi:MAG: NAD(P)H-hydrate epimerase, partial [Alphaproteobacteria bacterium]